MQQWLTGLCGGKNGLGILYDAEIGELQSIGDTYAGLADVALTTRPAKADSDVTTSAPAGKTYAYAPVAITAATIAYWMDDRPPGSSTPT